MKTILLIVLLILFTIALLIVAIDSNRFVIREYTIESDKIKENTDFLFVSDIHCKEYGKNNVKLFSAIDKLKVDFSLVGGDVMVARAGRDQKKGTFFLNELSERMPVYMAYGNHEFRARKHPERYGFLFNKFISPVNNKNFMILDNETVSIGRVNIIGFSMDEPYYTRKIRMNMTGEYVANKLGHFETDKYNIMLAHDPEYFEAYSETDADLVLSGHFHGGIARIPGLGGVISPRFKLFPDYSGGIYERKGTKMIVSCGLGMHSLPFRFLNPAELSIIHLKSKEQ